MPGLVADKLPIEADTKVSWALAASDDATLGSVEHGEAAGELAAGTVAVRGATRGFGTDELGASSGGR